MFTYLSNLFRKIVTAPIALITYIFLTFLIGCCFIFETLDLTNIATNFSVNNILVFIKSMPLWLIFYLSSLLPIPILTCTLAFIQTRNLEKTFAKFMLWLGVANVTLFIVLISAFSTYLFPNEILQRIVTETNYLKELHTFSITLYAFVAGFLLLFSLNEFSSTAREFKEEVSCWFNLCDLLRFFLLDKNKVLRGQHDPTDQEDQIAAEANHVAAIDAMKVIRDLSGKEQKDASTTPLERVYEKILLFKVVDDNDKEALGALIQKYCTLGALLRQRMRRRIDSPLMLTMVLWSVAALTITFTVFILATEIATLFELSELNWRIEKLVFLLAVFVFSLPVALINFTIGDLKQPYEGEWSIEISKPYLEVTHEAKRQIDEALAILGRDDEKNVR